MERNIEDRLMMLHRDRRRRAQFWAGAWLSSGQVARRQVIERP